MKKMAFKIGTLAAALFCVVWLYGAADYTINTAGVNNQVITVLTSGVKNIVLATSDYTLVHLNIQNDGTTASVSTDYAVVMNNQNAAGTAVTMDATYGDNGDGKIIVGAGAAATFNGALVPQGADGPCEIQIKAVGHGCKMELIRGHYTAP